MIKTVKLVAVPATLLLNQVSAAAILLTLRQASVAFPATLCQASVLATRLLNQAAAAAVLATLRQASVIFPVTLR